jgi:hypothetical protein
METSIRVPAWLRLLVLCMVVGPLATFIWKLDPNSLSWSPDTQSYIDLFPYRQPLYGYFFQGLTALGMSLYGIAVLQVILLALAVMLLVYEASRTRVPALVLIILVLLWWFPLATHFRSYAASFTSEAIFYPLLTMLCALCLRFRRTGGKTWIVAATTGVIILCFVREAALALVPATIATLSLVCVFGALHLRWTAAKLLILVAILTGIVPLLIGRSPWRIRPPLDLSGFMFLPRVVMVPADVDVDEPRRSQWNRLNASFIAAGASLSCAERSLYESQLQEAVRYHIGPRVLLGRPDAFALNAPEARAATLDENLNQSFGLFQEAVLRSPWAYITSTFCHFWAMTTAGTHVGTASRQAVYSALQHVDSKTWKIAPFRTDYPLNRFDAPLKTHTQMAYRLFRLVAFAATLIGIAMTLKQLLSVITGTAALDAEGFTWMLLTGWLLGHSLLVALAQFPEPRYVMANFIVQWTLLALALDALHNRRGARGASA